MSKIGEKTKTKGTYYGLLQERIAFGGEACRICGTRERLTVEHIVPINLLLQLYQDVDTKRLRYNLVYNYDENFEILCKYHNVLKGGKLDMRNPKTLPLLKKAIEDVEVFHGTKS